MIEAAEDTDTLIKRESCGNNKVCCPKDFNMKKMKPIGCGTRFKTGLADFNAAITGQAQFAEFASIASVYDGTNKLCTGSLIDSRAVITSANCVHGKNSAFLEIRVGSWKASSKLGLHTEETRKISKVLYSPTTGTYRTSVAVLILESPVSTNMLIGTSCLSSSPDNLTLSECVAVGWGRGKSMNDLEVTTVQMSSCPGAMGNFIDLAQTRCFSFKGIQMIPGAALMCPYKNDEYDSHQQIGMLIMSQGDVAVFSDLNQFKEWIDKELTENGITNELYTYTKLKSRFWWWIGKAFHVVGDFLIG